ncbi:hypothetical protein [Limosilactobacillus antri]|uniref:YtxH domain-containing protein n=1 Tax=Limosilactobacillus antri DSM 16041 TaxID=525309 RepID=C8P790_9LACO|nr:hypothetical protein [Limosilactobacillus antri]EEW53634.1 hypothetical protein HMPREF0494_1184 [Limosilactobacillus antri DSM 16041]KRK56463.1 hypothetical protein FC31_GL001314 [Limosilactobacillus antri DSM 16041]
MSKKLLAGIVFGSVATAAGWALLPEAKRQELRARANSKLNDAADYVTDYALTALDIVDERLAEMDNAGVADGLKAATQKVKAKKDQVVDHLANDDFDEQTAAIREKLANASPAADQDDDIVIDATADDREEN